MVPIECACAWTRQVHRLNRFTRARARRPSENIGTRGRISLRFSAETRFAYTESSVFPDSPTTCGSGGTADALASGASWGNPVEVQILSSAPNSQHASRRNLAVHLGVDSLVGRRRTKSRLFDSF